MADLSKLRDELDRSWDFVLGAENAVLAQRRRAKELESAFAEERQDSDAIPDHLKGRRP